ncbi:hypothetical protein Y032_0024g1077 [Ancylostoma ceylanicum]|uniref:C2H2-type domain-containing protein n=1 Tax=Ancylostoma ceylanicum TaxID=53326 RepID=A0A016UXB9_9BILA|nr:hypothetical protein Y032_0024g1077 [Ancylostoma ceylanicum]
MVIPSRTSTPMSSFISNTQSTDPMADDDTDENDLSIDNPSEMHNYTVMEEDGEVSGQARDVPEQDPLGIQHLHNELNTLKKMNVLKTKIQCAVCDEKCEIRSQAEEFVSHVNRRHARIHIYGCAHCNFTAASRSPMTNHLRKHKLVVEGSAQQFLKHVVQIPLSVEQTRRLKELTEACFGVRWRHSWGLTASAFEQISLTFHQFFSDFTRKIHINLQGISEIYSNLREFRPKTKRNLLKSTRRSLDVRGSVLGGIEDSNTVVGP